MSSIKAVLDRRSNVRNIIRERYRELYQGWKIENPHSHAYTIRQLNTNIRNALSVDGRFFQ